jgi:hypothetical protein
VKRRRWPWVVGGIFAVLILTVAFFPWSVLVPTIERKVTEAT